MSRAYIRLDPGFFERKAFDQSYTAAEIAALVGCFCLGESQTPRGYYRNERVLRALLGPYGRCVPTLIERGDLTVEDSGRIYVDGWSEWQEGDVTVKERMARVRSRRASRDGGERNGRHGSDRNAAHGGKRHKPSRTAVGESENTSGTGRGRGGTVDSKDSQGRESEESRAASTAAATEDEVSWATAPGIRR